LNQHLTQQLALELTSGLQVLSLDDVVDSEQQQLLISYLQIL